MSARRAPTTPCTPPIARPGDTAPRSISRASARTVLAGATTPHQPPSQPTAASTAASRVLALRCACNVWTLGTRHERGMAGCHALQIRPRRWGGSPRGRGHRVRCDPEPWRRTLYGPRYVHRVRPLCASGWEIAGDRYDRYTSRWLTRSSVIVSLCQCKTTMRVGARGGALESGSSNPPWGPFSPPL